MLASPAYCISNIVWHPLLMQASSALQDRHSCRSYTLCSVQGTSDPEKVFDRTANLENTQIINYRVDPQEKWCVLIGIAPGAPERFVHVYWLDPNKRAQAFPPDEALVLYRGHTQSIGLVCESLHPSFTSNEGIQFSRSTGLLCLPLMHNPPIQEKSLGSF